MPYNSTEMYKLLQNKVMPRLGFSGEEITDMSVAEAAAWFKVYSEAVNAAEKGGPVKYRVRRDPAGSIKGRRHQ